MSTNNIPVSLTTVSKILGINRRVSINSSKTSPPRLDKLPDDILDKVNGFYQALITNEDFALILKNINEKEAEKELLNITNYDRFIKISKLIPQDPRSYPNNMIPKKLKNLMKLINNRGDYLWMDNYIEQILIIHKNIYSNKLKKIEEEFTNMKSIINNNHNDTDKFNVAQKQVNLISLQLKITKETEKNIVENAENIQKKLKAGNIYIDKDIIKVMKKTFDNDIKEVRNQLYLLDFLQRKLVENLQEKEGGRRMRTTFINKKNKKI